MALSISVSVAKRVGILCSNGTNTGLQELVPVSIVLYKDAKMSEKSPGGGGPPAFCVRSIDDERMKGCGSAHTDRSGCALMMAVTCKAPPVSDESSAATVLN